MLPLVERIQKLRAHLRRKGPRRTLLIAFRKCLDMVSSWLWDVRHEVETRRTVALSSLGIEGEYSSSGPMFIKRLNRLKLNWSRFVFIDLGCGKGKVLLMAAQFPFRQIVGVEFAPELAELARKNVTTYRGLAQVRQRVEVRTEDAADYEFPLSPLVIYCFNPFSERVMRAALSNLERSLWQHWRETYLIYANPVLESVVAEYTFLQLIDTADNHRSYRCSIGNRPMKNGSALFHDQCTAAVQPQIPVSANPPLQVELTPPPLLA